MDATRSLREDHQKILKVLDSFERELCGARTSRKISQAAFGPFIEFFRGFVDRCHHGKEEDRLFPCLQRCGMPGDCGPIGVMLEEHRQGRFHVRSMAEALPAAESGASAAVDAFLGHGLAFLEVLRGHITKEDGVLFQMADQLVQGDELARLKKDYQEVEQSPDFQETARRCNAIADRVIG